jgi:two-component system chemotaxis response regulator CheB
VKNYEIPKSVRAIIIGGSAGSFQPITKLLSRLPSTYSIPLVLALHRLKHVRHGFVEALSVRSKLEIKEPFDKEPLRRNRVYLAPANYHLSLDFGNTFALSTEETFNNSRPSIDYTFVSASQVFREKTIGILFSGANKDGAIGMKKIKDRGGLTIIQDPEECSIPTMPLAAQKLTDIDLALTTNEIIDFLLSLEGQTEQL